MILPKGPGASAIVTDILELGASGRTALLALNNMHAAETSFLGDSEWRVLLHSAYFAKCIGKNLAFLIAFDEDADYLSPNFLWFKQRLRQFVYVDRVVVDISQRGQGLARRLYQELFIRARADDHQFVACEVNAEPPNPVSDALHVRLGFTEVGRATLPQRGKTVKYLVRRLR